MLLVVGSIWRKRDRENFAHDVMRTPGRVSGNTRENPKAKPMTRDRSSWSGRRLLEPKRNRHSQNRQPAAATLRSRSYFLRIQETPYINLNCARPRCVADRRVEGLAPGGASPAPPTDTLATRASAGTSRQAIAVGENPVSGSKNTFVMSVLAPPHHSSFHR